MTQAIGIAVGGLVKLYRGLDFITSFGGLTGENGKLVQALEGKPNTNRSKSPAGTAQRTAQQRQAEAAAAKRAKELAALQTKQVKAQKALTDEQKKQNALKKAGSIFDLEQVQLIAALKGKLSDEDRKRVELQFALITGNVSEAQKLTYEIAKAQGLGEKLAGYLASAGSSTATVTVVTPSTNTVSTYTGTPFGQAGSFVDTMGTPFGQAGGNGSGYIGTPFGQAPVVVQIDGKTIATALQDTSLSGIPSSVNRTLGSFGR
jgi:predicted Zn-dependent protease